MSKKIKSLIIAGLLVIGMSGNAFATEGAELPAMSTSTISSPVFEDGKRVEELQGGLIVVEMTEKENGEYDIVVKWKEDKIKILGVKSYYENGSIDHTNYFEELYHCNTLEKEGEFVFGKVLGGGEGFSGSLGKLVKVEVTSEDLTKGDESVVPPEESEQPTGDGKVNESPIFDTNTIYAKYLENMNALGSLDNKVRSIGIDASISEEAWKDWVNKFNASDNKMIIEGSGEEYKVYISLDNETKGELVETIIIKFYDASNKGWLPEITPGTGQSLAVGGIVILAVAGVGLLVNNKKKKDEEK